MAHFTLINRASLNPSPKKMQYNHFYKNINGFQAVFLNKKDKA
jgi:hypothetical protein